MKVLIKIQIQQYFNSKIAKYVVLSHYASMLSTQNLHCISKERPRSDESASERGLVILDRITC